MPVDASRFRATMLDKHNAERAQWNVPPLAWNDALADAARDYAAYLAQSGRLEHSADLGGPRPLGENLWMGTRGAYGYDEMVGSFLDERRFYVARAIPDISSTGSWSDAAHYSQIIWRTTTAMGCGIAAGRDFEVLVCRYDPAGNIWGRTADDDRGFDAPATQLASNGRILRSR
tara:strand:- start:72089 stop:72610 length:522 start_codon:yes stop_codon:yes gene_type:complete